MTSSRKENSYLHSQQRMNSSDGVELEGEITYNITEKNFKKSEQ